MRQVSDSSVESVTFIVSRHKKTANRPCLKRLVSNRGDLTLIKCAPSNFYTGICVCYMICADNVWFSGRGRRHQDY